MIGTLRLAALTLLPGCYRLDTLGMPARRTTAIAAMVYTGTIEMFTKLLKIYMYRLANMLHCFKIGSCSAQTLARCQRLARHRRHAGDRQEGALRSVATCVQYLSRVLFLFCPVNIPVYTNYLSIFLCPKSMHSILTLTVYFLFCPK